MKLFLRAGLLICLLLAVGLQPSEAQVAAPRVHKISVRHVGPPVVGDALIIANIRSKVGDPYSRATVDDDIKNLYATGYFFKIQVGQESTAEGVDLIYVVQGKPIVKELNVVGNKKMRISKLRKKLTSKVGQPLDNLKLFNDAQEMKKVYEKAGYQKTTVTVLPPSIDEAAGSASVTFEIHETPKVRLVDVVFDNAKAFPQKKLRKVLKTRRHWMFSWITGTGVLKEDEFADDKDKLVEFYQNEGYIDFAIEDVKFEYPKPTRMILHIVVSEGRQYKVGTVDIRGNKLFTTNDFINGLVIDKQKMKLLLHPGSIFKPEDFNKDTETIKDFYGSRGYLEREMGGTTIVSSDKTPNPTTGTMDVSYVISEGEKCYIEKIEIKGNVKTKDRVVRRELSVFPGDVYDMVRVKLSKTRLEGMDYFEKVDTQAEDTDVPNRKNLVVGLEEKNTGSATVGAGFDTVQSIVGFVELKQANFDLFNPPTFTGGGQKMQVMASIGTELQDYEVSFTEPWFMDQHMSLGVNLFHRDVYYDSINSSYTETFDGGNVSLARALGSEFLIGKVGYTMELVHIAINSGFHAANSPTNSLGGNGVGGNTSSSTTNISSEIADLRGNYFISKFDFDLAYDTRNNARMPDRGQRTEIDVQAAAPPGSSDFYKLELKSSWFFKGFENGHILQIDGRTGVVAPDDGSSQVPIFERWFLGGLYSLRGYKYHQIGPRDQYGEALGGDTYFYGTLEYSIPIVKMVRFAVFYDIGNVFQDPYSFRLGQNQTAFYSDNWGLGLRLNLPIGPLRLDYGIPINHDTGVGSGGHFQVGVGYQHSF